MKKRILSATILALLTTSSLSYATENNIENKIANIDEQKTTVTLTAKYSEKVEPDMLTISVSKLAEGKTSEEVQKELTESSNYISKSIQIFNEKNGTKIVQKTDNINIYPIYNYKQNETENESRIVGWRGDFSVSLKSKEDFSNVSKVAGELDGFRIQSFDFSLSPEKLKKFEASTIKNAITAFKNKSELISTQFGSSDYKVLDVNVSFTGDGSFNRPVPYRNMNVMSKSMDVSTEMSAPSFDFTPEKINVESEVSGVISVK